MAKKPKITMNSPKGIAVWPRLTRPDTKFDELGAYTVKLAVDAADAEPFLKKLQDVHKETFGKAAPKSGNTMFEPEIDNDTGEETGRILFKFRATNKKLKDGTLWDRQPKFFDAKGNRITEAPNIGGGSKLRIFTELYVRGPENPKPGITLQPIKVQVIDLVEYTGGGDDDENPFDEEDGFVVDEDETFGGDDDDNSEDPDNPDF